MARGKHLFPCRTQQLSLVAVTILGVDPWENSTVPNYIKSLRIGGFLFVVLSPLMDEKNMRVPAKLFCGVLGTVPNYVKSLLFGGLLFLLFARIDMSVLEW